MSRTKAIAVTAGTLAAGALLATGITGIAHAADSIPSPSATASPATPPAGDHGPHGHGPGPARPGGHGERGSQPLHGESVVKSADGTISTELSVRGSVTAVSPTSITVKAEDGFSATYAVSSSTDIRTGVPTRPAAPAAGEKPTPPAASTSTIADVKVGDVTSVRGTVSGSTNNATSIHSMTAAQAAQLDADRASHEAAS